MRTFTWYREVSQNLIKSSAQSHPFTHRLITWTIVLARVVAVSLPIYDGNTYMRLNLNHFRPVWISFASYWITRWRRSADAYTYTRHDFNQFCQSRLNFAQSLSDQGIPFIPNVVYIKIFSNFVRTMWLSNLCGEMWEWFLSNYLSSVDAVVSPRRPSLTIALGLGP